MMAGLESMTVPASLLAMFFPGIPVPMTSDTEPVGSDIAVRTMHQFARCTVNRHYAATLRIMAVDPGSTEYRRRVRYASRPECLQMASANATELRFQPLLLRGGLYEWVYRRDFRNENMSFDAAPPLEYPWADAEVREASRTVVRGRLELGECIVRAAPNETRALLQTEVTRLQEQRAFDALVPHVSGCVPEGQTLAFSRPILRGIIAEALYHMSVAARARGRARALEAAE